MTSLASMIADRIETDGSQTFLKFLDRSGAERTAITHEELDRSARRLAAVLLDRRPVGPVLLVFDPGPDFVEALLACLYAGLIAIPAPAPRPGGSLERLEGMVAGSAAGMLLTGAVLGENIAARAPTGGALAAIDIVATDRCEPSGPLAQCPGFDLGERAPVLIQYTSGSTLSPRGVVLDSCGTIANLEMVCRGLGLGAAGEETFINWMPHYHDMGLVGSILIPLAMGYSSVHLAPLDFVQDPARWLRAITHYRGTFAGGPPMAFDMCVGRVADEVIDTLDLSSWRSAFCGAEPVFESTLAAFRRRFARSGLDPRAVFCVYGMAEMTVYAGGGPRPTGGPEALAEPLDRSPCYLDDEARASLRIVAEDGTLAPDGVEGEIWIDHPSVATGYLDDPAATTRTFGRHLEGNEGRSYLATGDLGVLNGSVLQITGRIKDVLIRNGLNLSAADIERLATQDQALLNVNGAAAVEGSGPRAPIALVLEKHRGPWDPAVEPALTRSIRRTVFDGLGVQIDDIRFVEPGALPRTTSGKIQRARVRAAWLRDAVVASSTSPIVEG